MSREHPHKLEGIFRGYFLMHKLEGIFLIQLNLTNLQRKNSIFFYLMKNQNLYLMKYLDLDLKLFYFIELIELTRNIYLKIYIS